MIACLHTNVHVLFISVNACWCIWRFIRYYFTNWLPFLCARLFICFLAFSQVQPWACLVHVRRSDQPLGRSSVATVRRQPSAASVLEYSGCQALQSSAAPAFGWRLHRARSCAWPLWSSATSVRDRSARSFLRSVVLAPGRCCALALSLPSARRSPEISRAAVQSPLPWRLHPCNTFIHACNDSLILSFIHSSTQLFTYSLTRSSIYVPFTSAD
jgi:hypothetical protein